MEKQLLIGGYGLHKLGSSRGSKEIEYLVHDQSNNAFFIHDGKNYYNANGSQFFAEVWKMEENNIGEIASPQALLELVAYTFVQHCSNHFFQKADEAEFDIKFLVRSFNLEDLKIVTKYITAAQHKEIKKIIKSVRK
jgi:hypothetical protein